MCTRQVMREVIADDTGHWLSQEVGRLRAGMRAAAGVVHAADAEAANAQEPVQKAVAQMVDVEQKRHILHDFGIHINDEEADGGPPTTTTSAFVSIRDATPHDNLDGTPATATISHSRYCDST